MVFRSIAIHPAAPAKPSPGAACNGCGVCCLIEPCPIGRIASHRWRGACARLQWDDETGRYRCGLLAASARIAGPAWLGRALAATMRRWIAAGAGCDCDAEFAD